MNPWLCARNHLGRCSRAAFSSHVTQGGKLTIRKVCALPGCHTGLHDPDRATCDAAHCPLHAVAGRHSVLAPGCVGRDAKQAALWASGAISLAKWYGFPTAEEVAARVRAPSAEFLPLSTATVHVSATMPSDPPPTICLLPPFLISSSVCPYSQCCSRHLSRVTGPNNAGARRVEPRLSYLNGDGDAFMAARRALACAVDRLKLLANLRGRPGVPGGPLDVP